MKQKNDIGFPPEAPDGGQALRAELLAPAGDLETALAAFEAGADAVYCGLNDFSARAFAKNFTLEDLSSLVRYARATGPGRRVYVTFNTVVDEGDLEGVARALAELEDIGPDALIVQDLGVARMCRRHFPGLAIHASTQLAAHNLEGVLALKEAGFSRVVLARELSIAEISSISKRCGVELEVFIHGALCYSISGLCLFSAMEKDRSGNRGRCAYCCRMPYTLPSGKKSFPFSMKDLRAGEDVRAIVAAGAASLKIEGRMKSPLYVASVVRWYRELLDRANPRTIAPADLETVFSRRTTPLYLEGRRDDVIDDVSLGHLGAPIGVVKRITKDRQGRSWLRFHTSRALERHDGLQFASPDGGKPVGFGIGEMRQAISRVCVYEVPAGTDVEILMPETGDTEALYAAVVHGATVYCSMSNAVKRMFPAPSFRPSDFPGTIPVDVSVRIGREGVQAEAVARPRSEGPLAAPSCSVEIRHALEPAKNPGKTREAVEKAFAKLGGTCYFLGSLELSDDDGLFVPMSLLNDLRRDVVERLDSAREDARRRKAEAAVAECGEEAPCDAAKPSRGIKLRLGQKLPPGEWDEAIVLLDPALAPTPEALEPFLAPLGGVPARLALPVFTPEPEYPRLRACVKRLLHSGYKAWEAADLAGVRMLRALGVDDLTADWTLYAFNSSALAALSEAGVRRFVASPENGRENLVYLAESGYDVEFLTQQSTPLFISLHRPAAAEGGDSQVVLRDANGEEVVSSLRGGLWTTVKRRPRAFDLPGGDVSSRADLSWDAGPLHYA